MTDLVGGIYGHYRLDQAIGEGALGAVYLATNRRDARTVALKLFRADLCAEAGFVARLRELAPRLIGLDSPQIVPLTDWGEVAGRAYLVSPLLESGSLRQHLDSGADWRDRPLSETLALFSQAASGVADLHQNGIVHGDIRPENIFIEHPGTADERLRVADYGLGELVAARYLVGKPAYIPPEQLSGQSADRRGDIYSLGVVLYELLTGAQPFAATSFSDAIALHEQLTPVPPRALRPAIPAVVEAIILRCLAHDPDARYISAAALAADLRAIADELRPAADRREQERAEEQPPQAAITLRAAESTDLIITPGEPQTMEIIVANEGRVPAVVTLQLEGALAGWAALPSDGPTVAPGASERVTLTIAVARDAHNSAGEYPITLRATPRDGEGDEATLAMLWTVRAFTEGSLTLQPAELNAAGTAIYTVMVDNLGNAPVRRSLSFSAAAPLTGSVAPETVDLDPYGEATATLTVTAPRHRLGRSRRLPFAIEASSSNAEPLAATGEYLLRPRLPLWPTIVALLILLVAGAGAASFALLPETFAVSSAPTPTLPISAVAQEVPTATPSNNTTATTAPVIAATATGRAAATSAPLAFSTTSLSFGAVPIGGNAVQNIQVRNTTTRPLTFGRIQIDGANAGDFSRSGPCGLDRLDIGLTCPLTVIFSPTGGGTRTARLTISLADGTTQAIALSGVAVIRSAGTPSIAAPTRPVPPLAGSRSGQAATLVADGRRLLVAGGRSGPNTLKSVELYDLATNTWSGGRDLGEARAEHTATALPDGKVVVIGGRNGTQTLKSAEEYDPATQSWSPFPALTTEREGHTTTLLVDSRTRGYRLLVLGGRGQGGVLDSGEIYDSNTRTWTETPRLLAGGRAEQTATLLTATRQETPRLLLVGGTTANGDHAKALLYEPLGSGEFRDIAGEPDELIARSDYTATLIEATGQIAFIGGTSAQERVATVTLYDPAAAPESAWRTTSTALLNARASHTATLLPYGRLLIVGGRIGSRETTSTELLDPARLVNP